VTVAHLHEVAHVDLLEGRQHRGGILGFLESLRDALAKKKEKKKSGKMKTMNYIFCEKFVKK